MPSQTVSVCKYCDGTGIRRYGDVEVTCYDCKVEKSIVCNSCDTPVPAGEKYLVLADGSTECGECANERGELWFNKYDDYSVRTA